MNNRVNYHNFLYIGCHVTVWGGGVGDVTNYRVACSYMLMNDRINYQDSGIRVAMCLFRGGVGDVTNYRLAWS